jgi:mannose-6-phosphate isomerase class I
MSQPPPLFPHRRPNYDKFPAIAVPAAHAGACWCDWPAIAARLREAVDDRNDARTLVAVECYSGVQDDEIRTALAAVLRPAWIVDSKEAFRTSAEIDALVAPWLGGDDPIFGRMCPLELNEFLDPARATAISTALHDEATQGIVIVVGPAAALLAPDADILIYADLPRWEGQLRQRRAEVSNLGVRNVGEKASLQYKRSFFIDWRVCDRLKQRTLDRWDFLLDTTAPATPKLVAGAALRAALALTATRPFRVVPFFDPGPWGGQWMKEVCDLDRATPNFAWCFDCVPEENSLLLAFRDARVEIPASDLVFHRARALLGDGVYARFGAEFPIRFDFLDTMGGGNLSFQVHPHTAYVREHFGLSYTQDESYYLLDAHPGARVYLGHVNGADFGAMMQALETAQAGGTPFPAEKFAARFPAKRHDHFLIPAGTLHCSGAGSMVLEISATPYIFTFKLWDWGRLGLDGNPRPINLARGRDVIRWERDADYVRTHLVNQVRELARGPGWREECTGLHPAEFIETRRHWFTGLVEHDTLGNLNVLNLVQGEEAIVESPTGAFAPFIVHYAETLIIPAAVGLYTIRPHGAAIGGGECATMKAFVRT